jgi:hypothetical protein
MTDARAMLETSPTEIGFATDDLVAAIEACFSCAQSCSACADACLAEEMVSDLRHCITINLNCADVCMAAGQVLSRHASYAAAMTRAVLRACVEACRLCADECGGHTDMQHCQVCAAACRRCEEVCSALLRSPAPGR